MQTKDKRERTKMKEEAKKTREWPWFVLVGLGKERQRFFRRSYIYIYIYIYIHMGHGMKLKREMPWLFLIPTLANYITGTPSLTLKKAWLYSDGLFLSEFTNKRVHLCFGQEARARFRPMLRL